MRQTATSELLAEAGQMLPPLFFVVAVAAIVLKMLDLTPSQVEKLRATVAVGTGASTTLRFESLEEAEAMIKTEPLVPIYFPDYLAWPPATIYAQRDSMVLTVIFRGTDLGEGLSIRQGQATGEEPRPLFAEPFVVQGRYSIELSIAGQDGPIQGFIIEGKDSSDAPRNQLSWRLGNRDISLVTPHPVSELARIAESMHPRGSNP
jgi:hypothetical protein